MAGIGTPPGMVILERLDNALGILRVHFALEPVELRVWQDLRQERGLLQRDLRMVPDGAPQSGRTFGCCGAGAED